MEGRCTSRQDREPSLYSLLSSVGSDQIASRLSMEHDDCQMRWHRPRTAKFPDRGEGHLEVSLRQVPGDLADDIIIKARKIGRFPGAAVSSLAYSRNAMCPMNFQPGAFLSFAGSEKRRALDPLGAPSPTRTTLNARHRRCRRQSKRVIGHRCGLSPFGSRGTLSIACRWFRQPGCTAELTVT